VNSLMGDPKNEMDLSEIYPDALDMMKPQLETVSDWFPDISEEIKDACKFFLEEGA